MADKIRAIKPATKFIALTGTGGNPLLQESTEKDFEFDHYIVKPVLFQELFAAIEQCMGEIAQTNG
jgi:CheY-like chemotaxis protein